MSFKFFQILLVAFFGFLFAIAAIFGYSAGKEQSQTKVILANAVQLDTAIKNFYQDQERFPSVNEWKDQNTLGQYLSVFPVTDVKGGTCGQDFDYKNPKPSSFELYVCLPAVNGKYQAGWNLFSSKSAE